MRSCWIAHSRIRNAGWGSSSCRSTAAPANVKEGVLRGFYRYHEGTTGKRRVQLMGSGSILLQSMSPLICTKARSKASGLAVKPRRANCGQQSPLGGEASVKGLGHRAEVRVDPANLGRGQSHRAAVFVEVKPEQPARRDDHTEDPERRSDV